MKNLGPWFKVAVAGLAAAAAMAAAASTGGHGTSVTADGPAGCVVLKVTP
jgi:hypothetical protein